MPGKFTLEVTAGPIKGQTFAFEEHDIFIFGREEDCHARLAANDTTASRHHFLLEVNPPQARLQDIGSRNGTYINGKKYAGRPAHMTPEEARNLDHPVVDLKDGDEIRVGETAFSVRVEIPTACCQCGDPIPAKYRKVCEWQSGLFVCPDCREKVEKDGYSTKVPELVCPGCGKKFMLGSELSDRSYGSEPLPARCKDCRTAPTIDQDVLRRMVETELVAEGSGSIDHYELGKELGCGGMGCVYLAKRKSDGQSVAIKVMRPKVEVSDRAREGFKREIDVTRSLTHPNIVSLYDFSYSGNLFFFALELCEGGSLMDVMTKRRRKFSLKEALEVFLPALDGLAFAHEQKFVHRDLKPQNILLTAMENGVAKISDFGLAKSFDKAGLSGFTKTGDAAGTLSFMPKEQLTNFKYVKPVSDVWSMAATLYFMLTGEVPRDIVTGQSAAEAVMRGDMVPIRQRDSSIPSGIANVIDQALAAKAKDRYQDGAELSEALRQAM
jgi:eukaryotic-like serine/threonine-protein kinase